MLRWLKLLVQFLLISKAFEKSASAPLNTAPIVTRIRRGAVAILGTIVSVFFFMIALAVAIVDLGLQMDRGHAFTLTGLLASALILFALSVFFAGFSYFYGFGARRRRQEAESIQHLTEAIAQARKNRSAGRKETP